MVKRVARVLLLIFVVMLVTIGLLASRIYSYSNATSDGPADAAIVLGAAVWGTQVSPVFQERINHGIDLYQNHKIKKLIFTGGQGNSTEPTRYQGLGSQTRLLAHETYYYIGYLLRRPFLK